MRLYHVVGLLALVSYLEAASVTKGSHFIVLPSTVVFGDTIPVTFSFYNTTEDIEVFVHMLNDTKTPFSTVKHVFPNAQSDTLHLPAIDMPTYNPNDPTGKWIRSNPRVTILIQSLKGLHFAQDSHVTLKKPVQHEVRHKAFIQTDKAIYKPGETVNFRVFGLTPDLLVDHSPITIEIHDSKNNLIKLLANLIGDEGVAQGFIELDTEPVLGDWQIKATQKSNGKVLATTSKAFTVDKYVLPKFDVTVELPPYVLTSDTEVHGTVKAKYTYGKPVIGTILLRADLDYRYSPWKYHGNEVMLETTLNINGEAKFTVPLDRIANEVDPNSYTPLNEKLSGYHLNVTVMVTESLNNLSRNASEVVQFYSKPYIVSFMDSMSQDFFRPALEFKAYAFIGQADQRPVISTDKDVRVVTYVKFYDKTVHKTRATSLPDKWFAPPSTGFLELSVIPPANADSVHLEVHYKGFTAVLNVNKPHWMTQDSVMALSMNSSNVLVGDQATFNIVSSKPIEDAYYLVLDQDNLVIQQGVVGGQGSTQLYFSLPVTMAMTPYVKLIVYYYSMTGDWNADAMYFSAVDASTQFKNTVSIGFDQSTAEPGETVSLRIHTDPTSLVSIVAVDQSVLLLKTGNDITKSDVMSAFAPPEPPKDTQDLHRPTSILQTAGLEVISDLSNFGFLPHYRKRQIDCNNFGGSGAGIGTGTGSGSGSGQQLQQVERTRTFFPETWLWTSVKSGADGQAQITSTVPDTITSWVASAFSVNSKTGLGIVDASAKFTTFRPFFISLNLPYSIVRGEEVVLQVNIFNYMAQNLTVVVTLDRSDDFSVLAQLPDGSTDRQSKQVVENVKITAGQAGSVFVPIVANNVGVLDINVKAQSVLAADGVKRQLIVEPEGTRIHANIPRIIESGSHEQVDLSFPSNVVPDSQRITVSVIGDYMGPVVDNMNSLLRIPSGCGEQTISLLAPDVFLYGYLRRTNQLTPDIEAKALSYMEKGYQREQKFKHTDGSYSIWGERDYSGSMWLTAFVFKSFSQASKYIHIDTNILTAAARWMYQHQDYNGMVHAVGTVHDAMLKSGANNRYALTAFVLIATADASTSSYAPTVAVRARRYLEANLVNIQNTYDLAITSYALARAGSRYASSLFQKLDSHAFINDGKKHWEASLTSPYRSYWGYQSRSPLDIEVTAYCLLYYIESHQLTAGLPVFRWLLSQRNSLGGFVSTQDTVLGLQALSEYGGAVTGTFDVTVSSGSFSQQMTITKSQALVLKTLDVPISAVLSGTGSSQNVSVISLDGHGQGSALAQVSVAFNIETEVSDPAFNVSVHIVHESLRSIVVETCARANATELPIGSGMSVFEVTVPTGFTLEMESRNTDLGGARNTETKKQVVYLYYDRIETTADTCCTLEMIRTDMVAKTKPAPFKVYDYYEPDLEALTFYQSKLLSDSTFCDVCTNCGCR